MCLESDDRELLRHSTGRDMLVSLAGYLRVLDFEYMSSVLSSILSAKDEFSWSSDNIRAALLSTALSDLYPRY